MIRFNIKTILIWKVNYCKIYFSSRTYSSKFSSTVIRQTFLDYFLIKNDHKFIRSSPVIPFCDPTVAFVNAGMNQFKGIFLGKQEPVYTKVANSQKCIRVGGKHNDFNVVGMDGYHHTFFEMLGNWSFGDYFKKEACEMAWNLLTKSYGLNPSSLYITYFEGDAKLNLEPDLECRDIWRSLGISDDHIIPFGSSENFWEMGSVGPCGPCTEIHIDTSGKSNRSQDVNKGYPDLIELWNIVFIQYNRNKDSSINVLPKHHIDTGMGLERLTAVLQNKKSNYDTDIFKYLFETIQKNCKSLPSYEGKFGSDDVKGIDTAYRIIADHSRMVVACLADGMIPEENQKLRRVIRKSFSISETVFETEKRLLSELAYAVVEYLGDIYPEMQKNIKQVQQIIKYEEDVYKTIRNTAVKEWKKIINKEPKLKEFNVIEMPGIIAASNELISSNIDNISPQIAFKLYDTYGIDENTISELAKALNLIYNPEILKNELENARNRTKLGYETNDNLEQIAKELSERGIEKTKDDFKYRYEVEENSYIFDDIDVNILSIVANNQIVDCVCKNTDCYLILNKTNLYTEAGGQISDTGFIKFPEILFEVESVENVNGYIFHKGKFTSGSILRLKTQGVLSVNKENRIKLMSNHTATHILNAALKKQVGFVCQKSSKVMVDSLLFNVGVYTGKLTASDIENVENFMQSVVNDGADVKIREIDSQELLKLDEVTLIPGEVYPDKGIRLVEIRGSHLYSCEPCCGTHVLNTKHIGDVSIVGFRSLGRSTTSLIAVTGKNATKSKKNGEEILEEVLNFHTVVNNATEEVEVLNKMLVKLRQKLTTKNEDDFLLPIHIKMKCTKILTDLSKQLRDIERHSLKQFIDMEMNSVLETNCMRSKKDHPYIVHFLGCSSILDNIPLQRATKICGNVPCLVLSYTDDVVKARCCVPCHLTNENFNAQLWLTKTVADVFKTNVQFAKEQNNAIVCNMKPKRINKIQWDQLLEEALKSAKNYADTYL